MHCRLPQLRTISSHQSQLRSLAAAADAEEQQPTVSSQPQAQVMLWPMVSRRWARFLSRAYEFILICVIRYPHLNPAHSMLTTILLQ